MAEKRMNPFLIGGAVIAVFCLSLVMCSQREESYTPVNQVPEYDSTVKQQDGDTQADTIKALQAYAKAAVNKADAIHDSTQEKMEQILVNRQSVSKLENAHKESQKNLQETQSALNALQQRLDDLNRELADVKSNNAKLAPVFNEEGLPIGFGFEDRIVVPEKTNQGQWYEPIGLIQAEKEDGKTSQFSGLLPRSPNIQKPAKPANTGTAQEKITVEAIYTLPKDATLTDGLALTALIGRIPVDGQAPDPYPVKIYIGKENLLANGHNMPEVEGMIFSGLGFGDWNLSCVSARLTSATFIFEDGSIVNHSGRGEPLGYISDPSGVPCISGDFVTNAPEFISQRIGLAALGAAGSAYAEAQQQRQTSSLTGSTTSTVVGDINKLAAGEAVQSATDEVSNWLLARQRQSFDAVFVKPGAAVSVHLNRNLPIDKSSISRKLRYEKSDRHINPDLD